MSNSPLSRRACAPRSLLAIAVLANPARAGEPPIEMGYRGLHGYIASNTQPTPSEFRYGAGFYAAVWPLIERPINGFQIGLPSTWIIPDNSDNTSEPLCPPGTLAREHMPERGPTYWSVFQTLEGGLGYWAGNRFHYDLPKFSMNGTTDCYNTEVASPGWPFFRSSEPLPDDRLGVAQISNRLLIPPDGLPFAGSPNGQLLGYAYMALPLTDAHDQPQPTGELSWTLFLNAANFKGPLAYYVPVCWSRVSRDYPFDHGRGLDARAMIGSLSGAMEINTVPELRVKDDNGVEFTKIPQLQFPVDHDARTVLVRDVTMYSKIALFDQVQRWRDGGDMPGGRFDPAGATHPAMTTGPVTYRQNEEPIDGINELATPTVFEGNVFGLQWSPNAIDAGMARFPTFFRDDGQRRTSIPERQTPGQSGLREATFPPPNPTPPPYSAEPLKGAWKTPGPAAGPFEVRLVDGSTVRYSWYRFIDQPVFAQCAWSQDEREELQRLIEQIHRHWPIDGAYLPAPTAGELVGFDEALFVRPPEGMDAGYVPIVTWQGLKPE